ncbi:MAG TPA: hypothetical protein VIJ95_13385 [Hanamia sp.]
MDRTAAMKAKSSSSAIRILISCIIHALSMPLIGSIYGVSCIVMLIWLYSKRRNKEDCFVGLVGNPPESEVSFSFMESFVDSLPESRIRVMLSDALSGRKPFRHFNHIIHQSDEREAWFTFRQRCLKNYVAGILAERLWNNKTGN